MFESRRGQKLSVFTLLITLTISNNKSHTLVCAIGPCAAMVAPLTSDQKITCSNRVEVKSFSSLLYLLLLQFLIINRTCSFAQSKFCKQFVYMSLGNLTLWRNDTSSASRSEFCVFEFHGGQQLFIFTLLVTLKISINNSYTLPVSIWPCGAMVARLAPDQKVTCSNHVEVKSFSSLLYK